MGLSPSPASEHRPSVQHITQRGMALTKQVLNQWRHGLSAFSCSPASDKPAYSSWSQAHYLSLGEALGLRTTRDAQREQGRQWIRHHTCTRSWGQTRFTPQLSLHVMKSPDVWWLNFLTCQRMKVDFICLLSKGLSRVFSSTTAGKHQFFDNQHSYGPTLPSVHDYWKKHRFDYTDLC